MELTASISDLNTSLANVKRDDFAHCTSLNVFLKYSSLIKARDSDTPNNTKLKVCLLDSLVWFVPCPWICGQSRIHIRASISIVNHSL